MWIKKYIKGFCHLGDIARIVQVRRMLIIRVRSGHKEVIYSLQKYTNESF